MLNAKTAFDVYQKSKALGEIALNSEYTMVIDGKEDYTYLIKQFPVPQVTPEDVIEVPLIGGLKTATAQTPRFDFRGSIAFKENMDGAVRSLIEEMQASVEIGNRPKFNATIYLGTQDNHKQKWRIIDAVLFGFDPLDTDSENRSQIAVLQGQIFYMYFPDVE